MLDVALAADALLAYAIHEHQLGHVRRIDVTVAPSRLVVEDDGRGMGLDRDGYVAGLFGTLAGGEADVQLHGVGLSLVAASVPRLEVESRRGGSTWTQAFVRGVPTGPPGSVPGRVGRGTRITLAPVTFHPPDLRSLTERIARWRRRHPALDIVLQVEAEPARPAA